VDLKTVYKQSKMFKTDVTVCSGGIIGMGESVEDRAGMLVALSTLNQPESVPINALVPVEGTPMEEAKPVEIWEMIRMVAATRIIMRNSSSSVREE
jgi:biotin synthase